MLVTPASSINFSPIFLEHPYTPDGWAALSEEMNSTRFGWSSKDSLITFISPTILVFVQDLTSFSARPTCFMALSKKTSLAPLMAFLTIHGSAMSPTIMEIDGNFSLRATSAPSFRATARMSLCPMETSLLINFVPRNPEPPKTTCLDDAICLHVFNVLFFKSVKSHPFPPAGNG